MKKITLLIGLLILGMNLDGAEIPKVPSQINFAGIKLKITESARAEIQKQVNSLRASDKYFKIKLDRVNLFFPIIERVFREEKLPDDFKYLVIQESALIGDAVSSANAVGFWQFKDFTGREVGLRIDRQVDERMNIVSATRGAAKYMKTNNFYYKNWVYALTAYNTGRGGARKYVKEENYGAAKMTINKKTHWYVKTFLAHKIAFQNEIGGKHSDGLVLEEYQGGEGQSLTKIAAKFGLDPDLVGFYNKWLKRGTVPGDKNYTVVLPSKGKISDKKLKGKKKTNEEQESANSVVIAKSEGKKYAKYLKKGLEYADVVFVKINGLESILSKPGDDVALLAKKGGVPVAKLMKFNDLTPEDEIRPGYTYYMRAKRGKAKVPFHVLKPNESLWDVSQQYGVKLKRLRKFNKIKGEDPVSGTVLWLQKKIPKGAKPTIVPVPDQYVVKDYNPSKKESSKPKVSLEKQIVKEEANNQNDINKSLTLAEKPKNDSNAEEIKSSKSVIDKERLDAKELKKEEQGPLLVESLEESVEEKIEKGDFDIHLVEAGQTLFGLAKQYGVTVNDLISWNNLDPYNTILDIGQKLQVKIPFEAPAANTEIPEEKVLYHIVQPGETAYAISKKYDIEVSQLTNWNGLDENASISIGQKLKVSGAFIEQQLDKATKEVSNVIESSSTDQKVAYHEVKPGDTLYSISRKYGTPVKDLIRINNKSDGSIQIGEKIKVREE